jgi:hypothetical protein
MPGVAARELTASRHGRAASYSKIAACGSLSYESHVMGHCDAGGPRFETVEERATALAVVHAELILIRPFREGNRRCGRLLAILMGLQAGLRTLDFGEIRGAKKRNCRRRNHRSYHHAFPRDGVAQIGVYEGKLCTHKVVLPADAP